MSNACFLVFLHTFLGTNVKMEAKHELLNVLGGEHFDPRVLPTDFDEPLTVLFSPKIRRITELVRNNYNVASKSDGQIFRPILWAIAFRRHNFS